MADAHHGPYHPDAHPPIPTGLTRRLRTSVVWQVVRFLVLSFKIGKLMIRSHG
jgi:hypothetical protein